MDDLSKNIDLFINILGMSRTSAVQKWDNEAFQRAFRWAYFFQQVYKKTKTKPNTIAKIAVLLEEACFKIDSKLGLSTFAYEDLKHSSLILQKYLLENPYLSNDFYLELVGKLNVVASEAETFKNQVHSLSKLKATLQVLHLVQKRFEDLSEKNESNGLDENAYIEKNKESHQENHIGYSKSKLMANARLLRECLLNVLRKDDIKESEKFKLHVKLTNMVKNEHGVDVLLYTLLIDNENDSSRLVQYIIAFIDDVLIPDWKINWKNFLKLPLTYLLSKCSSIYERFFDIYWIALHHCALCIQEGLDKNGYRLLTEHSDSSASEEIHKYYHLFYNHLQVLTHRNANIESKVEAFIRRQLENIPSNSSKETNIWKRLAHDLMIA